MQNVMETIKALFNDHLLEEPKIPLHVGEVMNVWVYYTFLDEAKRFSVLAMNHTSDNELAHYLEDIIYGLEDVQISKIKEYMKTNGIPLPDTSGQKSISDPTDVPQGAKMTDVEIANAVALKIATAIIFLSRGIAESVRDDVAMMFTEFHAQKLGYALKTKKMMAKRGWLKTPPYYYAPGIPIQSQ
jgi:rubrerythrin